MRAMILAAGRGSRLAPLTDTIPKPLIKVGGKALIEHHLDNLQQAGFKHVVVNVSWLSESLESYFEHQYRGDLKISIYREAAALETGGGVLAALADLAIEGQPFLVINADVMTDFNFQNVPRAINSLAHLFLTPNPEQHPDGDFILGDDSLVSNKPGIQSDNSLAILNSVTFSGISVLSSELFKGAQPGKFSLGDLFREYAKQGLITGQMLEANWFDVGTLERLALAEQWQAQKNSSHEAS